MERSAPVVSGSDTNTANLSKSSTSSAASFTVEHVEAAAAASGIVLIHKHLYYVSSSLIESL